MEYPNNVISLEDYKESISNSRIFEDLVHQIDSMYKDGYSFFDIKNTINTVYSSTFQENVNEAFKFWYLSVKGGAVYEQYY